MCELSNTVPSLFFAINQFEKFLLLLIICLKKRFFNLRDKVRHTVGET